MQPKYPFVSKQISRQFVVLFVAAASIYLSGNRQVLRAETGKETMPEIVAKLREWRQKFISVRVNWRSWNRKDFVEANPGIDPDQALGVTDYAEDEFLWADWGGARDEMKIVKGGKVVYRWLIGSNGTQPWDATTKHSGNQAVYDLIKLSRADPGRALSSTSSYVGILGIWSSFYGIWLDEAILRDSPEVVSHNERLGDQTCILIKAKYSTAERRFWLDREHAFLPCQVEQIALDKEGNPGPHGLTWTVTRFEQIDGQHWWPMEGRFFTGPERTEFSQWFVQKVTLNETIPRSDMDAPKGTPGITQIIDYVNGDVRRTPGESQTIQPEPSAKVPSQNANRDVTAVPRSKSWWWLFWAGTLLLALGAAFRFLRR